MKACGKSAVCLAVLALLAVCGGCGGSADGKAEAPRYVLTYAENQAEDYPTSQGALRFAELVEERTRGNVEIQVHTGGTLGDERKVIEQLKLGGVDFARVSLSPLAEFVPKLNVLQMPYLYRDSDHMWNVLEGEIGDDFLQAMDGSGLVGLSWYDAGARSFYNSVKPIERLEDMEGLRIRVQESGLMEDVVKALGARAVPMAYGEVYSALEMGTIDGAENNWPSYESTRHYEAARYFTLDEHTRVPEMQLVSENTWNKLPEEYRQIIRKCAEESAKYERRLWIQREKISEERVRRQGCTLTELSQTEKRRFQQAVAPVYEKYCSEYTDIIEEIIEIGKKTDTAEGS